MFSFYQKSRKVQKPEEPSASQLNLLLQDNKEYFDNSTNTHNKEYADKSTNTDGSEPDYRSLFERFRKYPDIPAIFYENFGSFVFLLTLAIAARN